MKKFILTLFSILILIGTSMFYHLVNMDIEELILCSTNEGGIRIPSNVCQHYMVNHRITEADIIQLSKNSGIDFILNGESHKKYYIAEHFIAKGLNINGTNRHSIEKQYDLSPLHTSVIYNDAKRAKFLINHGANTNIQSKSHYNMTPLELAQHYQKELPKKNMSDIIKILSAHNQ